MSREGDPVPVLPFLQQVLERDGAAVETLGADRLFAVLPEPLRDALDLPGAATLDLSGQADDGALPFPLEGAPMQWCVDRVRSRGRRAAARLPTPPQNPAGRLAKVRDRLVLPNAKIAHAEAMRPVVTRALLEFGYEARSEEQTDGRIHLVVTAAGIVSADLADPLLAYLGHGAPQAPKLSEAELESRIAHARPVLETQLERRLAPFCNASRRRMETEAERIAAYHDRLAREAERRRGRARPDAEALASKREAILRQRAERLEDLAERHAVSASWWPASALELRYSITLCRFHLLRRRREVTVDVQWDPYLGDFIGTRCAGCGAVTFYLHVCDAAGHVTCAACAAPCDVCGRISCRACPGARCGCSEDRAPSRGVRAGLRVDNPPEVGR